MQKLTCAQIIGKVPGGGNLVVGAGDGGLVPAEAIQQKRSQTPVGNDKLYGEGQSGSGPPGFGQVGFGNATLPSQSGGVGEPLQGQEKYK